MIEQLFGSETETGAASSRYDLNVQHRIPTELDKMVTDAHPLQMQDLFPDIGEPLLDFGSGSDKSVLRAVRRR